MRVSSNAAHGNTRMASEATVRPGGTMAQDLGPGIVPHPPRQNRCALVANLAGRSIY